MSGRLQVLVVDDDESTCQFLRSVLNAEGYGCEVAHGVEEAEPLLHQGPIHLALVDIYFGKRNGLEFLERIKALQPQCNCVVMTAHASVETVARSVAEGALEYLGKPLLIDELLALVRRLESRHRSGPATDSETSLFPDSAIVGRRPKMLEVYRAIARVATSSASVLITGASGTGKELVARAIHAHSPRAHMPFTPINCGSFRKLSSKASCLGTRKGRSPEQITAAAVCSRSPMVARCSWMRSLRRASAFK
jgi:DNA-binding NtrC family response regulator